LAVTAETPSAALDVVKVVISGFGVLATIFAGVGLYLTYQNSQAERQLNTERLLTERFTKSVEQLGSKNIDVRLGGIYSLERIAKDSPKDHWTVMEVLTAFVRNKSPVPKGWADATPQKRQLLPDVTTDVQSALTVIGRRVAENDNVSRTPYTRFRRLDLQSSNLSSADLTRANLKNTNFRGTVLYNATIVVADLRETDLQGAYFNGARLGSTNLGSARLLDTNFDGADIYNVNFIDADYIAPEQIKQAKQWQKAYYDPDFSKQLGLQPQKLPDIFSDPALNP
jgi:hypothetical protein